MKKWRSVGGRRASSYSVRYQVLCEALPGQASGGLTEIIPVYAPPVEDAIEAWESAGRPGTHYINDHARVTAHANT